MIPPFFGSAPPPVDSNKNVIGSQPHFFGFFDPYFRALGTLKEVERSFSRLFLYGVIVGPVAPGLSLWWV